MKILCLHCDYFNFKPKKKALKKVKLKKSGGKGREVKNCLAILTAIEKDDSGETVKKLVKEIKDISDKVKLKNKNIVLYPYAHLSSNLGSPDKAKKLLDKAEKLLKKDFEVTKAPFGYYKEFELKCKGHPLSELSREISGGGGEENVSKKNRKNLLRQISESKLDTRKLKEYDHRILGKKMSLFSFNDVAPGMVFWHNNGLILRKELIKFWREKHKGDYKEISTPQIMDKKLWQVSGHWEKYKENNFITEYENRPFLIKPMNCPGGMLIYKTNPKSYKDLPLRVGELGIVHRQELSGVLGGLFRVVQMTQDDAHIFCTENQLEKEIKKIISLVNLFYKKFNLKFDHIELSTRPEKRIGSDKIWDKAEDALEKVLKKEKIKYKINEGDGAFYGPKIDFHVKDSQGRTWQLSTIQLDFATPERFDLNYKDKDNKKKRPVMIHRVIYGSLERFIGILLEHTKGHLPTWLSPIQVRVISFTDKNIKACKKFIEKIGVEIPNLRLDADFESNTVNSKIKQAEIQKIPYIIVIGDKEEKSGKIAVREEGKVKKESKKKFISKLKKEIEERE